MPTVRLIRVPRSFVACLSASVAAHGTALFVTLGTPAPPRPQLAIPTLPVPPASPLVSGDSFEIPVDEAFDEPGQSRAHAASPAAQSPASPTPSRPQAVTASDLAGHQPRQARPGVSAVRATSGDSNGDPGGGTRFGAVGDRSAVELTTAFTRGFPQAASADPLWVSAPFGRAGTVNVDLILDETGSLVDARATGNASPALAEGLRRTLAFIRSRAFVADARETHLRVSATVSPDQVHDGLHGDVFAIGGSFEGNEGSAFFALAIGRRIDMRVQVVR